MKTLVLTISSLLISLNMNFITDVVQSDALAKKAEAELHKVLREEQQFVKLHAAEYLIWLGQLGAAREAFLQEEQLHHDQPKYRVVIWRVLAQTEPTVSARKQWTDQIFKAFADENGEDRIHAAESLAKLKLSPTSNFEAETNKVLTTQHENLYLYTLWASSYANKSTYKSNKPKFLNLLYNSKIDDLKRISAFVLRREGGLTALEWTKLVKIALAEVETSPLKKTLLNTAVATVPAKMIAGSLYNEAKASLVNDFEHMPAGTRFETAMVLADHGATIDLPLLADFLEDKHTVGLYEKNTPLAADIRATAAYAILKIKRRNKS